MNEVLARFVSKLKVGKNDCLEWMGPPLKSGGYGNFRVNGKAKKAHRFLWEFIHGPVQKGLELDHLCRNPICVNPLHLEPVTHKENMRRGYYGMRTHCKKGHPYDADNTYICKRGKRSCKMCKSISMRQWYLKNGRSLSKPNARKQKQDLSSL